MNKFGNLAATSASAFRVVIIDAVSEKPIKDKDGNHAWIDVLPSDGEAGRAFDKEERAARFRMARKGRKGATDDVAQLERNVAKLSVLTKSWHLVDPVTNEVIDVPCTEENAKELYGSEGMNWLFVQAWVAANDAANFMKRSAKISTSSP